MGHACPKDQTGLSETQYLGIRAQSCARCQGCWLAEDGVRKAFAQTTGAEERYDRFCELVAHEGRKTGNACGACGEAMYAIVHRGVELDVCSGCGGIWFDGGELSGFLAGGGRKSLSAGAVAGVAGLAALGGAGLAAAAGGGEQERAANGESPLSAAADIAVDAASSGGAEVVGEVVGGAFSLLVDLFSGL